MTTFDRPLAKNSDQTKARILASAREEFEKNGILGLRVADVAQSAGCAVSLIYRYFIDRDGLLAQILGDMFDEGNDIHLARVTELFYRKDPISLDEVLDAILLSKTPEQVIIRSQRIQILAASTTNHLLRARIEDSIRNARKSLQTAVATAKTRLPSGTRFDDSLFIILLFNTFLFYNDLLGEEGISDEDHRTLLRDLLTR